MKMTRKRSWQFWAYIIIIPLSVILAYYMQSYEKPIEENRRRMLWPSSFKGNVVSKLIHRCNHIYLVDKADDTIHILNATQELYDSTSIGDTIIKQGNSNNCFIKNADKNIRCNCYYENQFLK